MSLSWRLFSGGKDYFSLLAARRNKEILEENLRAVKLSVASSLENAWQSMVDAYENLDVGRRYLEAAGAQSEIITAKYLNGLVSYQEWYQVENDYISAKKNYLSAMKDAVLSETLWKNILGISP
jgi:outer membrane protein TolC